MQVHAIRLARVGDGTRVEAAPLVANGDEDPRVGTRVAAEEHPATRYPAVPVENGVGECLAERNLQVDPAIVRATALQRNTGDLRHGAVKGGARQ